MYDIRPDRVGWTVHDELGRPLLLHDILLMGLEHEAADELASLLNRSVYCSCPERHEEHESCSHQPLRTITGLGDARESNEPECHRHYRREQASMSHGQNRPAHYRSALGWWEPSDRH